LFNLSIFYLIVDYFFFQAEDGIRDFHVTGVQTCALPILDLAVGARCVYVCMEHVTKNGAAKIVEELTYPITGKHCVNRIYTDLCVIELKDLQAQVIEIVDGLSFEELQQQTGCKLVDSRQQAA